MIGRPPIPKGKPNRGHQPAPLPDAVNAALEVLNTAGWTCTPPASPFPWETPGQFCRRHGFSAQHFQRRLCELACPAYEREAGPERIKRLRSNPALEAHVKKRT